jgi:heme/copper-type cytochrome/quinol oxidase subunit 1
MVLSVLLVAINIVRSLRSGRRAGNNPWGARTLEWMITSPAPYYNFKKIPIVLDKPYDFTQPLPYRNLDEETDPYPVPSEAVLPRHPNPVPVGA